MHQEEQKTVEMMEMNIAQLKAENARLKEKNKELMLRVLDPSAYMEWDSDAVLNWILSLEDGRFKPYEQELTKHLALEKVRGSHFKDIEEGDVKGWGVHPFDDKKALVRHIRNVVELHGQHDFPAMAAPLGIVDHMEEGDPECVDL